MADTASTDAATNGSGDFTPEQQAKVDAIVKDRLARQAAQLTRNQLSEEELEDLRTKAKQFEAMDEASKDDLEKANGTIEALQKKLASLETENSGLKDSLKTTTVKQLVTAEAAKAQFKLAEDDDALPFVDPEDAFINLDQSKIEYDDDGNATNIAALVGGIATSKPHLLGARRSTGPDMDGGPRETSTDRPDMTPEQEHAQWLAGLL